jgi:ssDNA-binding Zn-finger/Zn-ribbon topoisomerase 1
MRTNKTIPCPTCKAAGRTGYLTVRLNHKTGDTFYGCTGYPGCRFAVRDLDHLAQSHGGNAATEATGAQPPIALNNAVHVSAAATTKRCTGNRKAQAAGDVAQAGKEPINVNPNSNT